MIEIGLARMHAAIMTRRCDDAFSPPWLVTEDGISDFMMTTALTVQLIEWMRGCGEERS